MSSKRDVILAYLLLLLVIFLLVNAVYLPAYSKWQSERLAVQSIQADIENANAQLIGEDEQKRLLASKLKSLFSQGALSTERRPSDAAHYLQLHIKQLLEPHKVQLIQLNPSNRSLASGLSQSSLELSARMTPESLLPLLSSIAASTPSIEVELINIRNNSKSLDNASHSLEVSMKVTMLHISDSSPIWSALGNQDMMLKEQLTGKDVLFDGELADNERDSLVAAHTPNHLVGLFDSKVRVRFISPSAKHYRVAAINISKSARVAIIANVDDGKTRRLKQGDLLDVWRIESIDSNGVTLAYKQRREVLGLSR